MSGEQLADLLSRAAQRAPGRVALSCGGRSLSWRQLADRVGRVAGGFTGLGLRTGERVCVQLGDPLDFAVSCFAALRAGLTVVPMDPALDRAGLAAVIGDCSPHALVTDSVTAIESVAESDCGKLVVAGTTVPDGAAGLARLATARPLPPGPAAPIAFIVYTSGTSGTPRGVVLTHRALLANLDQCARIAPAVLRGSDVLLLAVPLFHGYGLGPGLGMLARTAATGVLADRGDPAAMLSVMAEHRVSVVLATPATYTAWARHRQPAAVAAAFATVRLAMSGAAPLPAGVVTRLRELTTVTVEQGYGATEASPVLTCTLGRPTKPGSIGRPVPGVELWLRDGDGNPVEDGDPGQIVVRGPNLFSGYWPDGAGRPDAGGWWNTGDLAYADADGDLFMVDRESILVSGFHVYPAEVEVALLAHPAVTDAAVVGDLGIIRAFVVVRDGTDAAALRTWCARSLPRFKRPADFVFLPALPRTATGKVRKSALRGDA